MTESFIAFFRILLLLGIEGAVVSAFLLPAGSWLLPTTLALPTAAFINVLLVFAFTVVGMSLSPVSLTFAHLLVTIITFLLLVKKSDWLMDLDRTKYALSRRGFAVVIASLVLLGLNVLYSASHAVVLPSIQYDSATNWTMRSRISYEDRSIAFDESEVRGMAKPQYPFLFHALQITANQGQREWNDTVANIILYLLSLSTFTALFLLTRRLCGTAQAAATIAAILGIPLLGLHLAQGYGDVNLAQYLLLSLATFALWLDAPHGRGWKWLLLSGVFTAACVWTKSEGLVFGLATWIFVLALIVVRSRSLLYQTKWPAITAVTLAAPWPIFAWAKGLSLTPHSSDTMIGLRTEGIAEAFYGLFSRGSFGIGWYAAVLLVPVLIVAFHRRDRTVRRRLSPALLLGIIVTLQVLFIYLATPNVRFLLNAESYYRQMMIPLAMLLLAASLCIDTKNVAASA